MEDCYINEVIQNVHLIRWIEEAGFGVTLVENSSITIIERQHFSL